VITAEPSDDIESYRYFGDGLVVLAKSAVGQGGDFESWEGSSNAVTRVCGVLLVFAYVIITVIVLVNLLIAMMGSSFAQVLFVYSFAVVSCFL